jgi:hypothetical protein
MLGPFLDCDDLLIVSLLKDFDHFVAEKDEMTIDSLSTVSSTAPYSDEGDEFVKKRTAEELGSSVDDDGSEFQAKESASFPTIVGKRKLSTLVPNGYTRIYKNDVIRNYANMFEYVLNSYDFSLFSSFFHTFTARKVVFSKEDRSVNPTSPLISRLQGRNACICFLSLCCQLSSDRIVRLNDFQLVQKLENPNFIELNGSYACKQHRLFDAEAGDIMELLVSQFPNLTQPSSSSRGSSKRQKKRRMDEQEKAKIVDSASIASSAFEDTAVTEAEDFDDDERYFVERFTSLKELSSACYSSPEYLSVSHVFDPLSSPCVSPACSSCSKFRISSSSSTSSSPSTLAPFTSSVCINLLESNFSRLPTPQLFSHLGTFSFTISLKTKLIDKISFVRR